MRVISLEQLAEADGIRSNKTWIAYKSVVYDVGCSELFANGKHYNHKCGCDLTAAMAKAPHVEDLIFKFKVVGKLVS